VRHDAGAWPQLPGEQRPQAEICRGQQIQGHDGGVGQVGREDILLAELDEVGDAGRPGVGTRLLDQAWVDLQAHAAGAIDARRGDGDAAVARAEIVHDVVGGDAGEGEHPVHDVVRRGHVRGKALTGREGYDGPRKDELEGDRDSGDEQRAAAASQLGHVHPRDGV
jgi:hypothetical protein